MQKCFLVANKDTQIVSYLEHRSIMEVVEEHRTLSDIDLKKVNIVDVDKLLYIHYNTDDDDLSFRSDLNTLRALLSTAFFHVSEAVFILVSNQNPMLEDLIHSALRDTYLTKDKVEIIEHSGTLMLSDVGKYVSGNAVGQDTSSSYKDVYIREADSDENDRFFNNPSEINTILPSLTDMYSIYTQRANVEAISAGVVVNEQKSRPAIVKDFSKIDFSIEKTPKMFVVSGERWTNYERAVKYIIDYFKLSGVRALVINCSGDSNITTNLGAVTQLNLSDIRLSLTPEEAISVIDCRLNQLGYIVEFLDNIQGIQSYIFIFDEYDYATGVHLVSQLGDVMHSVYVAHYNEDSVKRYLSKGVHSTALFLLFGPLQESFNLKAYKKDLSGTVVAEFPTEDVDLAETFSYMCGSYGGSSNE